MAGRSPLSLHNEHGKATLSVTRKPEGAWEGVLGNAHARRYLTQLEPSRK